MVQYVELTQEYFKAVVAMANDSFGDNYIDMAGLNEIWSKGIKNGINASVLAFDESMLIGFRLTHAPGQWLIDEWNTPEQWSIAKQKVCYFKCAAVHKNYRNKGIAKALLNQSITQARKQGATAGIAQVWRQSPDNSAFNYFSQCGGVLIKDHLNRWSGDYLKDGYICSLCGITCTCTAAEMILNFE